MKKNQAKKIAVSFGISIVLTIAGWFLMDTPFFHALEMKTFDQRMTLRTHDVETNKDVVVILVDEASLEALEPLVGKWPWPRRYFAQVLQSLGEWGAKAVLFDILYTELTVPKDEAGNLGEDDRILVEATAGTGIAAHAFQLFREREDADSKKFLNLPLPKDFVEQFSLKNVTKDSEINLGYNKFYIPFDDLYQNSPMIAVVEFSADPDGVYRSSELIRDYQGSYFPVLSTAYLFQHFNVEKVTQKGQELKLDNLTIPLQKNGRYLINMKNKFTNYSISGVLATIQKLMEGNTERLIVNPDDFKDKIVFLGASATGVEDLKLTSLGNRVPGVYLHASIVSNILNKNFIHQADKNWTMVVVFLIALATSLLVTMFSSIVPSVIFFWSNAIIYTLASYYLLDYFQIWLVLFMPAGVISSSFFASFIYMTFTEGKEKKFLKAAFSNYISPELIDMMHSSGEAPKLGGDVGIRTAYFTDIQSFSTFSEKLSATQLVELLNEYLSAMTDILLSKQGTLDKYEGDAIIAFFGAPMPLPDHARRACQVALHMQEALLVLREKWAAEGDKWPKIVHDMRMRIGINSGEIVTGNMGSKTRMNYTMMGDAVNLAARLEEAAKQYGIFTHVSKEALELAGDGFEVRELDTIRVVGKSEPVTTYELLGEKGKTHSDLLELRNVFHKGLELYKSMKWEEAISMFRLSLEMEYRRFPELKDKLNPSKIYITRCENFKENPPPPDWDGVYTLTSK